MQQIKLVLTVFIAAAALLVLIVALFWRTLLTPEQKLRYGLVFPAAEGFQARARHRPDNKEFLSDYVAALVREGNLGRAPYLADLYGAEAPGLEDLRAVVQRSAEAAERGEALDLHKDPALQASLKQPAGQVLRYLEGYRFALLGDWASAKNHFAAIEEKKLPPVLRPYGRYYLARSFRLAGDAKEKARVAPLLLSVLKMRPDKGLDARTRYNLVSWYLSKDYGGNDGLALAKAQRLSLALLPAGWPAQKAMVEFGQYYLGQDRLEDALVWVRRD